VSADNLQAPSIIKNEIKKLRKKINGYHDPFFTVINHRTIPNLIGTIFDESYLNGYITTMALPNLRII